jgi:hypothetical protein
MTMRTIGGGITLIFTILLGLKGSLASDDDQLWTQFKKIKLLSNQIDHNVEDSSNLIFSMIRDPESVTLNQVVPISMNLEIWEESLQNLMDGSMTKTIYDYLIEVENHQANRIKQNILESFKGNNLSTGDLISDLIGLIKTFRMRLKQFVSVDEDPNNIINEILQSLKVYRGLQINLALFDVKNTLLISEKSKMRQQEVSIDRFGKVDLNGLGMDNDDIWLLSMLRLRLYLMGNKERQVKDYTDTMNGDHLMMKLLELVHLTSGVEVEHVRKLNYDVKVELVRMMMIDDKSN